MLLSRLVLLVTSISSALGYSVWKTSPNDVVTTGRREFLSTSALVATSAWAPKSAWAADALTEYQDADCKFSIQIPSDWEKTVQRLPDRRKIVLYFKPGTDRKTFMFVAYTPVRSDFTSLGSFGSVDEVSQL